ncbi:FAD-binding oxidoreductase [Erythrobacter sp.]|uniref:FAD-binding oxidoreductase n=1 Tax=Erythrobacter sp. TaxID=1042 RepID=UPI001425C684|nr:FAD-binding oxidoreductase [Erythrobacter sp.]QIQ86345.1 MAG: FAD-binding oxidoreductase [Erythrobacter sp.]
MATAISDGKDALAGLAAIVGPDNVLTDADTLEFYATDVFRRCELPLAVVRPASAREIADIVRHARAHSMPLVMRGGGASYTDAYAHERPGGVTLDFARMKAISIDEDNALVTVEPGVTWAELREALAARGLKTRFWGSYSGLQATVAGGVSMNAISHGQGTAADSSVSIEVVTGTGETIVTGSALSRPALPFSRHYGPDMTGIFTGDCGALGIKVAITLALERLGAAHGAASFDFASFEALHEALRRVAASGLAEENFGLDEALQQGQIGEADLSDKIDMAGAVMKNASSLAKGATTVAKMALAGSKGIAKAKFAGHFIAEGFDDKDAQHRIAEIRRIAGEHGREIAPSVPEVVRAMPFAPLNNVVGPKGERWLPMHAQLPHSAARPFHAALQDYWASRRTQMDAHGIYTGGMFMAVGTSVFIYEPTFYWPDARNAYHERTVEPDHLMGLPTYDPAPEAEALVNQMKREVVALMHEHGGVHYQIGRSYPYLEDHDPAHLALVRALKRELDPDGIINPGALGL